MSDNSRAKRRAQIRADKERILSAARAEAFSTAKQWQGEIRLGEPELLMLVGSLQLALRHARFQKTRTAVWVRGFVDSLIEGIPPELPALRELAKLGDDPDYDAL